MLRKHFYSIDEHNIQKAEYGIGGQTVPGGQILTDTVKGAVDDGVAVDNHQLHKEAS